MDNNYDKFFEEFLIDKNNKKEIVLSLDVAKKMYMRGNSSLTEFVLTHFSKQELESNHRKYYKIKKDCLNKYNNLSNGFVNFAVCFSEYNLNITDGVYHYWRLKSNSDDEMIVTKIKLEDIEEIIIN